jgi:hypothetical protein
MLKNQIHNMEAFLNDYGLEWIGESAAPHEVPKSRKDTNRHEYCFYEIVLLWNL